MKKEAKISLVTGASSGLGRDIAKLLCEKGHRVYVTARRKPELEKLRKECKKEKLRGEIKVIDGDLTEKKFRAKLIDQILKQDKKIDYLISNAGMGKLMSLENIEFKDIHTMFELNAIAGEHLTQLVLPSMKKRGKGRIIYVSSVVALSPPVFFASYNATKAATYFFAKSLRYELKGTGVIVSVVFPSRMKTPFWVVAFKCKGLIGNKQKVCISKYTEKAQGSLPIAKHVVKHLDSKRLMLLPDLLSKFSYHFLRHFQFIETFYMKHIMLPQSKKLLFHK